MDSNTLLLSSFVKNFKSHRPVRDRGWLATGGGHCAAPQALEFLEVREMGSQAQTHPRPSSGYLIENKRELLGSCPALTAFISIKCCFNGQKWEYIRT